MDYKNETINQIVSLFQQLEPMELGLTKLQIDNFRCDDHLEAIRFIKRHTGGKVGRQIIHDGCVWHKYEDDNLCINAFLR